MRRPPGTCRRAAAGHVLAYAREFTEPRPYRLDDLARAAGMSLSGVRIAYDDDEISHIADVTGLRPRQRSQP